MSSKEIRERFLEFFAKPEHGKHTPVPSASLVPDDPSVLLTTAGMQQFKPYYAKLDPETTVHPSIGKPIGKNAVSIQKSFRTSDIDEVGDESHLTFFEMLGNFSFGGYFKKEAIRYGYDFITKEMGLDIDYVTVFDPARVPEGDWRKGVPFDEESFNIWKNEIGLPEDKIRREGVDNFWGPTGNEGPCGPTTEIYIRGVEIWNIVFNEFYCSPEKKLEKLKTPGVDTGMGLERLSMVSQNVPTIFETDLFKPLMEKVPILSERTKKIIADHARGIVFLISDGVRPANKEAGYVLRRLIRRIAVYQFLEMRSHQAEMTARGAPEAPLLKEDIENVLRLVTQEYRQSYPGLNENMVIEEFFREWEKFQRTIGQGLKELERAAHIDAVAAFKLYESFGLPYEAIKECGGEKTKNLKREDFDEEFKKHQEISRAGQEKKFGGHGLLLDTGELKAADENELKIVTRLHTATHLLQAALRNVLGEGVKQMGSDITAERTRFDFTFERKLTLDEIKKVEEWVNGVVARDLPMQYQEMSYDEAKKTGALHFFKEKYPEKVKVYFVGESLENAVSKEFCGGPHVTHTGEVGKFRIAKEEAVGAGVRRIRGVVE